MTKTEFINRVMLIMNEAGMTDVDGTSFLGANNAGIDRYIEGSFENAWRMLATAVPKAWLTNRSFANYPVISNIPNGIGHVILPDDFYLLVSFKMAGWQKPVFEASIEDERVSAIQSNRYTRGSTVRPAAVIASRNIAAEAVPVASIVDTNRLSTLIGGKCLFSSKALSKSLLFDITLDGGFANWYGQWEDGDTTSAARALVYNDGKIWYKNIPEVQVGSTSPSVVNGWTEIITTNLGSTAITVDGITYYAVNYELVESGVNQIMKYYSLPAGTSPHTIEEAIYVPNVTPLTDLSPTSNIDINQRIIEPLSYVTAGAVFTIFQKDQLAASLTEKGLLMIPGYRSVKNNNVTFKQ